MKHGIDLLRAHETVAGAGIIKDIAIARGEEKISDVSAEALRCWLQDIDRGRDALKPFAYPNLIPSIRWYQRVRGQQNA